MDFRSPWPCVNNSGWLTFRYMLENERIAELSQSFFGLSDAWITCLHAKARDRIIISQSQLIGFFLQFFHYFQYHIQIGKICFWSSCCLERSCPLSNIDRNRKETTTTTSSTSSVQQHCSRYDLRFPRNYFFRLAQQLEIVYF